MVGRGGRGGVPVRLAEAFAMADVVEKRLRGSRACHLHTNFWASTACDPCSHRRRSHELLRGLHHHSSRPRTLTNAAKC